MGIGASTEKGKDKMNKEMVKDVKKERARSKSKKGSRRKSTKSEERSEKENIKHSKRMGMGNEERKKMKSSTNSLEERDIIALETVAESMEALVRKPLMPNKIKLMMLTLIKVRYHETVMPTTKVMWSGVSVAAAFVIVAFFTFHKNSKPPSPDFFITHVY